MRFPQDYIYLLRKHRRLALGVFLTVLAVTVALILFVPPRYTATSTLLLTPTSGLGAAGAVVSEITGLSAGPSPETQLEVIAARPNLEKVIERLDLDWRPEDLRKRVSLMHPKLTDVVKVSAEGDTAQQAADIVNALVEAYREDQARRHDAESDTAAGDVKRRLIEVEKRLEAKEAELTAWLQENRLAVPELEMQGAVTRLDQALQAEQSTRLEATRLVSEGRVLREKIAALSPQVQGREVFRTSAVVEALRSKLNDLHARRAAALYEYKPDQPEVKVLETEIASTEASLREALAGAVDGDLLRAEREEQANPVRQKALEMLVADEAAAASLGAKLRSLGEQVGRLRSEVSAIPGLSHRLAELSREREALTKVWGALTARYEELKVQQYAGAMRPQVIEAATPPIRKSRPRPVLWSAVGLLMACVLSLTACVVTEGMDRRVKTARDARDLLQLPCLGLYEVPLSVDAADGLWSRLVLCGAGASWRHLLLLGDVHSLGSALASAAIRAGVQPLLVSDATAVPGEVPVCRLGEPAMDARVHEWLARGGLVIAEQPLWGSGRSARVADRVLLVVEQGASADRVEEELLAALPRDAVLGIALVAPMEEKLREAAA
ncbi:MAG: hypothetical protein AMXMBFR61_12220 [Fimbriimonadales bacterium]